MEKTTNYDIFKKCESNRPLDRLNLRKIVASIKQRDLLEFRPITVNSRMEVIDGQHRLEAAKELGVPIYYIVQKSAQVQDIILLHANQKSWTYENYLEFYVTNGANHYIKLKNFMEKNDLTLRQAVAVLNTEWAYKGMNAAHTKMERKHTFKDGIYEFPGDEATMDVEIKLTQIRSIQEYIKLKTIGSKAYVNSSSFYRALAAFLSIKEVDFDLFYRKLPYKLDLLRACTKRGQYMKIFKSIYNWKNHAPIKDDFKENEQIA